MQCQWGKSLPMVYQSQHVFPLHQSQRMTLCWWCRCIVQPNFSCTKLPEIAEPLTAASNRIPVSITLGFVYPNNVNFTTIKCKRQYQPFIIRSWDSNSLPLVRQQCDQMAILLFQYLAFKSKEICSIALEVYQIRRNILPKYSIDPLNSPKSLTFSPNLVTLIVSLLS